MINPVLLLVAAGAAVMAFGRKKKGGSTEGNLKCATGSQLSDDGATCIPSGDHIVDEGEITSEGGETYDYRIWFIDGQVAGPYVGELLIDGVWSSGPMGPDAQVVANELGVFADSLDGEDTTFQAQAEACDGDIVDGPFAQHTYNQAADQWEPSGDFLDPAQVYEPGRGFCVIENPEDEETFIAQVYDGANHVMAEFIDQDSDIAASMAYYGLYNPNGPFPWVKFQLTPAGG